MLTIFTIPKPFIGHVGDIQRNAIESWRGLGADLQIVLVGDEPGVEEAARDAGVEHIGGIARNERGTPRLDSAFALTATVSRSRLWCLVNADIVLLDDFGEAVRRLSSVFDAFLMIGECRDLAVTAGLRADEPAVRAQLRRRAHQEGRLRGWAALDYFVFQRELFDPLPPFLIGRACFDNWLVWRARERHLPVIDATRSVVAVHQSHDYSHLKGGLEEAYYGDEAHYNERLAGGREHIYSLHDATHRLYRKGPPIRYVLSIGRARERARVMKASYDFRKQLCGEQKAQRSDLGPIWLLGVFPKPSPETTPLLDSLAADTNVDLRVLYAERDSVPSAHTQLFPRSVRVPGKPNYPINWAIWKSFHRLRPDCMVISGRNTFATHAAIAWCMALRLPYLLLIDGLNGDGRVNAVWRNPFWRAAVRRAAGVLMTELVGRELIVANGVRGDRLRRLPSAPDTAASLVLVLARSARRRRRAIRTRRPTLSSRLRRLLHH
jgi:hypothetical protein